MILHLYFISYILNLQTKKLTHVLTFVFANVYTFMTRKFYRSNQIGHQKRTKNQLGLPTMAGPLFSLP